MLVEEKNSMDPVTRLLGLYVLCVCHQDSNGNLRAYLSLTLFLTRQLICTPNVIKGHLIGYFLLIFKVAK